MKKHAEKNMEATRLLALATAEILVGRIRMRLTYLWLASNEGIWILEVVSICCNPNNIVP